MDYASLLSTAFLLTDHQKVRIKAKFLQSQVSLAWPGRCDLPRGVLMRQSATR